MNTVPPPVPRYDVFFKKKEKSKIKKVLEIYYKTLHITCFLNFGFFEFKTNKHRMFWNSISIIQTITFCCVGLFHLDFKDSLDFFSEYFNYYFYCFLSIYYIANVLLLLSIKPDATFSKLLHKLEEIDTRLGIDSASYNLEIKILIFSTLHLVFNVSFCSFILFFSAKFTVYDFVVIWICSYLYLVLVTYAFVFYSVNCRLKRLVSKLRTTNTGFTTLQLIYKSIVEHVEVCKTAFDPVFLVALLFHIPQVMSDIYMSLESYFDENVTEIAPGLVVFFNVVGESLIVLLSPAICAGMLATQADKIKSILHDKLLQVPNVVRVREIERFIEYVEARGFRFRVYKTIPLDAELPGMVLSFCVTYLIVIIQFTNKS